MGVYLNPGDDKFHMARKSKIYIDKSGILSYLNSVVNTEQRFVCVSRPRRFGKSMAANMIVAYYDRSVDASTSFLGLELTREESFIEHRNKYDVLQINMQEFLSQSKSMSDLISILKKSVLWDLLAEYPDCRYFDKENLTRTMADIYMQTRRSFVVVIDEWDCIFREYKDNHEAQRQYLDFLREWLKDKVYIGLAYMTGILPIKKYGTHSALNMFMEFSMTDAGPLAPYVGFIEDEVKSLCQHYDMEFDACKKWYDGYHFEEAGSIYSPRSVVQSMLLKKFNTYWNQTETFEALKLYIDMDFKGLKESIVALMAGDRKKINTGTFSNDMTTFHSADDVLTLLIHLGYLGYDFSREEVFIPNQEIQKEYMNAMEAGGWDEVIRAVQHSDQLLQATLAKDESFVANGLAETHLATSHLQYNDENALSYTVSLAYYSARQQYNIIRELPTGKGFADLVFIPKQQYQDKPALIIELKWNKDVTAAIQQIKDKQYVKALEGYAGKVLLVGINYDKERRNHECRIEEWKI